MAAFGRNPIGNGPYKLADGPDGPAWEHNVKIDLRPNPDYHGNRIPHNKGLRFEFYANLDTAYCRPAVRQSRCAGHDSAERVADLQARPGRQRRPAARSRSTRASTRRCGCRISAARRAGCAGWRCRLPSTVRRSASRSSSEPALRHAISPPVHCRGSIRTFRATTRWTSIPIARGNSGRKPTRSRRGAASTRSPTTPTPATRSGWTRWPTASRTCWASTRSARRSPPSPDSARRSPTAPSRPRSGPGGRATTRR